MTAHATPTGPTDGAFPSPPALARLGAAVSAYLEDGRTAAREEAVREALAALAEEAREQRLHGEHVLLALKTLWAELPEVAALPDRVERQRVLAHLVALCIDVYYGP